MKFLFKKILTNILVIMLVILPLRSVFSMPLDMSSDHCKTKSGQMEMTMMSHAGHKMASTDLSEKESQQNKSACVCCNQCDGDCAGCVHISAITYDFFQFSSSAEAVLVSVVTESSLTRTVSPPSRPPLIL